MPVSLPPVTGNCNSIRPRDHKRSLPWEREHSEKEYFSYVHLVLGWEKNTSIIISCSGASSCAFCIDYPSLWNSPGGKQKLFLQKKFPNLVF